MFCYVIVAVLYLIKHILYIDKNEDNNVYYDLDSYF